VSDETEGSDAGRETHLGAECEVSRCGEELLSEEDKLSDITGVVEGEGVFVRGEEVVL